MDGLEDGFVELEGAIESVGTAEGRMDGLEEGTVELEGTSVVGVKVGTAEG
eukprot:CAMPEP_0116569762 /NCGR_PEP_ID=MMETSP0397-20121206/16514_1 /TAXON_ID=216820 /ORGANISM="Cyclophora tenuis, Strain ECT3854" /LENGTH=50 /DNA_ID=CAMNT_0004097443 /DNA_START=9 /DNA_END=157 /DNA_ORIENTATION=-